MCIPGYDPVDHAGGLRQQHDVYAVGAVGAERHGLFDVGGAIAFSLGIKLARLRVQ